MNVHPNELIEYDLSRDAIVDRYVPMRAETKEAANFMTIPYIDTDSTLWIGGASQCIFFCNRGKQKFQHLLCTGADKKPFNITKIFPLSPHTYLIVTRRQGILIINDKGDIIHQWLDLPDGIKNFTSTCAAQISDHQFLFNCNKQLYVLDLKSANIKNYKRNLPMLIWFLIRSKNSRMGK